MGEGVGVKDKALRHKRGTVDAERIEYLLAQKYAPSAYAFLPQLRNGTGYTRSVRTADAVAMSLWPSRGIFLHGFEIKVHRGDWLNEMRNPAKAEEIARFCRFWSLVVAEGVCDPIEVPLQWGIIVATDKKLTVKREPQPVECEPPSLALVASILRNVNERIAQFKGNYVHVDDLEERVAAEVEKQIHRERYLTQRLDADLKALRERVIAFETASGVSLGAGWSSPEKIGEAVRLVLERGPRQVASGLHAHVGRCIRELQQVQERIEASGIGDVDLSSSLGDELERAS